jgi:hypothetical protein
MLVKLFTKCNLHNLYIPGFPALMESFYIQEKLMSIYAHKISNHFVSIENSLKNNFNFFNFKFFFFLLGKITNIKYSLCYKVVYYLIFK